MGEMDDVEDKASSLEEEPRTGDTAATSTEEDIEKGNLSAVSARHKRGPSPYKDNKETEKKHIEGNQHIGIRSMRWAI